MVEINPVSMSVPLKIKAKGFNPGLPLIPPIILGCPKSLKAFVHQLNHGENEMATVIPRNPITGPRMPLIPPNW